MNVSYSPPSPQAWTPYFSESYHIREIESKYYTKEVYEMYFAENVKNTIYWLVSGVKLACSF